MDRSTRPHLALFFAALGVVFLSGFDGSGCSGSGRGTPADRTEADLLPQTECRPLECDVWCVNGHVPDENGCPTCECREDPGTCEPVLCEIYCEHGFARDERGCEICACNPPPAAGACEGLSEKLCNATSGCRGIYERSCACSPCPPGVACICDCTDDELGRFLVCTDDRLERSCWSRADCDAGEICHWPCRPGDDRCNEAGICIPEPRPECRSHADCGPGNLCEATVTCEALGCPPSNFACTPCPPARLDARGSCVTGDDFIRPIDPWCCGID